MASVVSICNRALLRLGAGRITDIADDTKNARACNACYEMLRDAELRKHAWNFAIERVVLSPLSTSPAFDYNYQFLLPADCIRVLKPRDYPGLDWKIEKKRILTNQSDTLQLRYIRAVTDPNDFDDLFIEILIARMAEEMCEYITQSTAKLQMVQKDYKEALAEARRINAFEQIPAEPETDTWLLNTR